MTHFEKVVFFLTLQLSELLDLCGSRKDTVCSSPSQAVTV